MYYLLNNNNTKRSYFDKWMNATVDALNKITQSHTIVNFLVITASIFL